MKLLGFNFTKVHAERILKVKSASEQKISSDIEFTEIEEETVKSIKDKVLKVRFKYALTYDPKVAEVYFEGTILVGVEESAAKEIMASWKKKSLSDYFKVGLFNLILQKCTIKSLELEEQLNIPFHVKLPHLSAVKKN